MAKYEVEIDGAASRCWVVYRVYSTGPNNRLAVASVWEDGVVTGHPEVRAALRPVLTDVINTTRTLSEGALSAEAIRDLILATISLID